MSGETPGKSSVVVAQAEPEAAPETAEADGLALLQRFAPVLHFDALELWRPGPAEPYLGGAAFLDEKDAIFPGSPPAAGGIAAHHEERQSRLNPLPQIVELGLDTQRRSNQVLAQYGRGQNLAEAGSCYGRVQPGRGRNLFLQYWLFYPDNPCVLPPGRHDGDWELIQVRLLPSGDGYRATHVTVAGHGKPSTQPFESIDGGPHVFVGVNSHAAYLAPGAHPMLPLSDVCDPDADAPGSRPRVEALLSAAPESWTFWAGRWGMDRGVGHWLARVLRKPRIPSFVRKLKVGAGESPASPGKQGYSWDRPEVFHHNGTLRSGFVVKLQRLAHLIGRATWPRLLPSVRVEQIEPDGYVIDAKPAGYLMRRVALVAVAFDELKPDGTRRPLAMYSVRTGKPSAPLKIPAEGEVRWRAAGYNALRQRGEPGPLGRPADPPWPLGLSGTSEDDQGARRVFAGALTNYLRRRGSAGTEELTGRLSWFWLRLNQAETEAVIEAARRDDYVAPLGHAHNAAGAPIVAEEWALTDRGRKLERTRAFSLRDSIVAIRGIGKPVYSATEKWSKRVAAALVGILPTVALSLTTTTAIGVIVAGVALSIGVNRSMRGDAELRRAAEHWPRLRVCRPKIHTWQTTVWRPWERPPVAAVAVLYLVLSAVALRVTDTWTFNVWIALGVGVALGALAWRWLHRIWLRWYHLNKEFRDERERVRRLRRRDPEAPCPHGSACEATLGGRPADGCPVFGPEAPEEADRIPTLA